MSCGHSLDGSFPPSPAEDSRGTKRLSWGSLLQTLAELKGLNHRQRNQSDIDSVADMSLSSSDSSLFCYPSEEILATELVANIEGALHGAAHLLGCSHLFIPNSLLDHVGLELVHLAVSEPCGLRGALINLCVDKGTPGSLCSIEEIAVDSAVVPTFHVTLVLRAESGGLWPKLQRLFKSSRSEQMCGTPSRHQNSLRLSSSFRAMKRKLYCSGELLIEECS
ncbi:DNA damage-inducible transcript 4 protein-like [Corythoichthys intestinalis]|uniref:DNA damage-inducible transcript 4 protein-like n=1 Tax=Corythoichthys intestinalis TaxID=161448 RepID=UPI0025A676A9|nr:DNA damage-inducible transcript 4 protein-like [Corythoichthys intestinalis]XP_061794089.1 DNA damage-inducible transcript 4 protein-like [Nerophis lumbriciformis]